MDLCKITKPTNLASQNIEKYNYRIDVFPSINRTQAAEIDLDLQTRPSEGPNMSSV